MNGNGKKGVENIHLSSSVLNQQVFKFPYFLVKFRGEVAGQRGRDNSCHYNTYLTFDLVNLKGIWNIFTFTSSVCHNKCAQKKPLWLQWMWIRTLDKK